MTAPSLHAVAWPDRGAFHGSMCAAAQWGSGIIKAYSDELSQLTAGANGAHRMTEPFSVSVLQLDLGEKDFPLLVIQPTPRRVRFSNLPRLYQIRTPDNPRPILGVIHIHAVLKELISELPRENVMRLDSPHRTAASLGCTRHSRWDWKPTCEHLFL